jgi:hypothetical protein
MDVGQFGDVAAAPIATSNPQFCQNAKPGLRRSDALSAKPSAA